MLKNSIDIKKQEEMDYTPIPEDLYETIITDVNEVEQQKYESQEMEKVLNFEFTIQDEKFQGRKAWKKIRPILNAGFESGQPSNLYILMSAALGKGPTISNINSESINSLIGLGIRIAIKVKSGRKGDYNIITDFYASKK